MTPAVAGGEPTRGCCGIMTPAVGGGELTRGGG
jgi:hypothetical protein